MILNNITSQSDFCSVVETNLSSYKDNPFRFDCGSIILCRSGKITISVNLDIYTIEQGSMFSFFPHDILEVKEVSEDFHATMLLIGINLLAESTSRIEHIIFEKLHFNPLIEEGNGKMKLFFENIIENIVLYYAEIKDKTRVRDFASLQTRSLFIILSDYVCYKYSDEVPRTYSRLEEHFKIFMNELIRSHKTSREVSYYADKINITPKYLNFIVQSVSHKTCKSLIDSYIIMQLKLELKNTEKAVQEIAYEYNFPNQSFLGSYFKKYVGASPRSFRNEK